MKSNRFVFLNHYPQNEVNPLSYHDSFEELLIENAALTYNRFSIFNEEDAILSVEDISSMTSSEEILSRRMYLVNSERVVTTHVDGVFDLLSSSSPGILTAFFTSTSSKRLHSAATVWFSYVQLIRAASREAREKLWDIVKPELLKIYPELDMDRLANLSSNRVSRVSAEVGDKLVASVKEKFPNVEVRRGVRQDRGGGVVRSSQFGRFHDITTGSPESSKIGKTSITVNIPSTGEIELGAGKWLLITGDKESGKSMAMKEIMYAVLKDEHKPHVHYIGTESGDTLLRFLLIVSGSKDRNLTVDNRAEVSKVIQTLSYDTYSEVTYSEARRALKTMMSPDATKPFVLFIDINTYSVDGMSEQVFRLASTIEKFLSETPVCLVISARSGEEYNTALTPLIHITNTRLHISN